MHPEKHGHRESIVQNYFFNCDNCCCRGRYSPDRPLVVEVMKGESDMDFIAKLTPVAPDNLVSKRVLSVTDSTGTRDIEVAPEINEVAFTCEPSPGNNGTCFLTDFNATGASNPSNVIAFSLTPPVPPLPVPQTPTILSVDPVNTVGRTFKK